jgi:hypothetical protein
MGSICSCCKDEFTDTDKLIQGRYCFQCGKTFKNKKEYDYHKSECDRKRVYGGL